MATMHRRTRLALLAIVITLAALLLAAAIAVYVLLQPQRITDMLRQQARNVGLTLAVSAPAEPTLWPQPALVLHGITLSASNRPVLVAARARVELPWRTLLGGPPTITQMELDTPRLDLSRLSRVLAKLDHGDSGTPELPRINIGIRINHGSLVQDGKLIMDDIHLETGALQMDRIFTLQLSASVHDQPFTLALLTTPHKQADSLQFKHIHITLNVPSATRGVLDGQATWRGGANLRMALHGVFTRDDKYEYATRMALIPPGKDQTFVFKLAVTGPGVDTHLLLPLSDMAAWWREVSNPEATGNLPLPPLDGTVTAKQLDIGGMHMEGLHLTAGAAAASSAPAPASSAPTHP